MKKDVTNWIILVLFALAALFMLTRCSNAVGDSCYRYEVPNKKLVKAQKARKKEMKQRAKRPMF